MILMSSLWQEVQNPIPHISFADIFFESTSVMREWRHFNNISKFDFSATISNINAQFAPVNRGLNSASIRLNNCFESTSGMREWRY